MDLLLVCEWRWPAENKRPKSELKREVNRPYPITPRAGDYINLVGDEEDSMYYPVMDVTFDNDGEIELTFGPFSQKKEGLLFLKRLIIEGFECEDLERKLLPEERQVVFPKPDRLGVWRQTLTDPNEI